MKPVFKYYLRAANGDYYYVAGGAVATSNIPVALKHSPLEWNETDIRWVRNSKYQGIFRTYIVPVTFAKDGATILRKIFYSKGVEGKCTFEVHRINRTNQEYQLFYTGDIDFSQAKDESYTFQATVLDAGLEAIIKAKDNIPFEIDLLDSDSLKIYHDGVKLRGNVRYIIPEQGITGPITLSNSIFITPMTPEGINEATITSTQPQPQPSVLTLAANPLYHAKYAETNTVTISNLHAFAFWPSSASSNVKLTALLRVGAPGGLVSDHLLWQAPNPLAPGNSAAYFVNGTHSFTLNPGDEVTVLFIMMDNGGAFLSSAASLFKALDNNGRLDISSEYTRPATMVRAYRQHQVYEKLLTQMAGAGYSFASDHLTDPLVNSLDNNPWNTTLTCGDAVRGLGDGSGAGVPAKIKVSLNDLLQDSSSRDMAGIGVEGTTLRLEQLTYFYDNSTVIADVGNVKNLVVSPATEYIFNSVKVGYNYRENEAVNGKDDPFLTQVYATAGIRVKSEADWVSPFIGSYVTMEYIRANLGGKKTTDNSTDNDVCLIEISSTTNSNGEYLLERKQNLPGNSVTGLIAGSGAFNLSLLPKRCAYRNLQRLAIANYQQSSTIRFQTADQNAEVQTKLSATIGTIIEKAPIIPAILSNPLFLPIIFEFETKVPIDLPALIAANPYGRINFTFRGQQFGGFIDEVGIKPSDNASYHYKLLAAPDTDLSKLIH